MKGSDLEDRLGLLFAGRRFQEYVSLYFKSSEDIPENYKDLYHAEVAQALMALRRYDEALEAAIRFHQSGERTPKFARDLGRGLDVMGACQWMLGRSSDAGATWAKLCEGVRTGKYAYANDATGGIGYGLLLWFGAVSATAKDAETQAHAYLEDRWERIQNLQASDIWPAPAARFALGEIGVSEMIAAATSNPGFLIDEPREVSSSNETARRNLSTAFLVAGTDMRRKGREEESREFFSRAAALENPVSAVSWYLARYEVEVRH